MRSALLGAAFGVALALGICAFFGVLTFTHHPVQPPTADFSGVLRP